MALLLALLSLPAMAAAETIVVNTTADGLPIPGEESCTGAVGITCTLREAIGQADANFQPDTITFGIPAGSVLRIEESPLQEITEQVTIEGGTAAGATPGVPAIELEAFNQEFPTDPGLRVFAGTGTRIEGLAIGGFGVGIEVGPTEFGAAAGTEICGNYLGTELLGEEDRPNEVAVQIRKGDVASEQPNGTKIGGAGCAGNVISGNSVAGVYDEGDGTIIAGNSIGIGPQPNGQVLPNGSSDSESAGVVETSLAIGAMIGGLAPSGAEGNFIGFNNGPGVKVEGSAGGNSIRHNAIVENEGRGIEIVDGTQPPPIVASAASPFAGSVIFEGTVAGVLDGKEDIELEFFGSRSCGNGEGQTFLGTGIVEEAESGPNPYTVQAFVTVPEDETAITATATREGGATSEFSACATYLPPEPEEEEPEPEPEHKEEQRPPPTQSNPQTATTAAVKGLTPTNGEKVVVKPEEGKVRIKLPGTKKYVALTELKEIPVGAIIDATKGRVKITSIDPDGTEQTAEFFGGVFKVKQKEGAGLVVLELLDTESCKVKKNGKGAEGSSIFARPKGGGTKGKLWGSGHGNFRTEGNDGSATVRGTIWLVEDRCNGTTFFKTRRGVVSVRDFVLRKTLSLPAGKTYVAGEG